MTSHKIGTRDFFKFGQNRKSSTYGVQKNQTRPWYIFLVLKPAQAHRVSAEVDIAGAEGTMHNREAANQYSISISICISRGGGEISG